MFLLPTQALALLAALVSSASGDQGLLTPIDGPSACLYNNCRNGGICYSVSERALDRPSEKNDGCPAGFSRLQTGCFLYTEEKYKWSEASKFCKAAGALLTSLTVEDTEKATWLGDFVRDTQQRRQPEISADEQTPAWILTSSKWSLTSTRLASLSSKSPPFLKSRAAVCYAIKRSSSPNSNTAVVPVSCDVKLPFICEGPLPPAAAATPVPSPSSSSFSDTPEVHQCQCRLQYEGPWCETPLAPGVGSYGAGLKCADDTVHLSCPSSARGGSQRLEIDYAVYGQILNQVNVCTSISTGEVANFNRKCTLSNALIWLKGRCHGKSSCTASLASLKQANPCPGTRLQLQFRYRCVSQSSSCGANQFFLDGGCYETFTKAGLKGTWDDARMFCKFYGGELPTIDTLDAETVVTQALGKEMGKRAQQTAQVWVGHRQVFSEVLDDMTYPSARLSDNDTARYNNTIVSNKLPVLPATWRNNRTELLSREKRDEVAVEDGCLALTVARNQEVDEVTATWALSPCSRTIGWMCRFPAGTKPPPDAEDDPQSEVTVVQTRSVSMARVTSAPSPFRPEHMSPKFPVKGLPLPSRVAPSMSTTTVQPSTPGIYSSPPTWQYSSSYTQDGYSNDSAPSTMYPEFAMRTVVPPLSITFSQITPIPPIPKITPISDMFPTMTLTPEPDFVQIKRTCPQATVNGQQWQRSVAGTFVVHPCEGEARKSMVSKDIVGTIRTMVQTIAPEQVHFFNVNIEKSPAGFMFWTCVDTVTGPQYLPVSGPVTSLCEQVNLQTMPASAVPATLAEEFANYTASGGLTGTQILHSVDLLQTMMAEQMKDILSLNARRNLDFDSRNQATNTTEQFVNVVTRSVSNMLMDVHKPGWSELGTRDRSGAATRLIKAAEESASLLVTVSNKDRNMRLHYQNFAMQVNVFPASQLNNSMKFTTAVSDKEEENPEYNQLELPLSIRSFADTDGNVRLAFMQYSETLSSLLSPTTFNTTSGDSSLTNQTFLGMVNSKIIAAGIMQNNQLQQFIKFDNNSFVTLTLAHTYAEGSEPRCVFWNMTNSSDVFWDSTGCSVVATNHTHTVCSCNHLTNFAVLMDLNGHLANISRANKLALDIISYVGCVISIICLSICLIIFTFFRQLWCDRVTIHRNLVFCLLIAQFVFVLGVDRVYNQIGCSITAGILHYTLLAAFAWMLLEGLQLYMMLVQVFESEESHRVYYYAFGYGFPAIIVAVAAGIRPDHYGTAKYCWLLPSDGFVWSFVGPVMLVVGINMFFLIIALMAVFRTKSPRQQNGFQRVRGWLRGSVMLLCLLGTTWLFGLLYINYATTLVFAYLFTIANSLQGLFIFIFHCVMNEKVFSTVQRYIRRCSWCPQWCKNCIGSPRTSSASGSNSKTSSHSMKEGTQSTRRNSSVWNFLKKRGHRLSGDSSSSLHQLPVGKQMYDSDYWSKTSSYKSNRVPYNRQHTMQTLQSDTDLVKSVSQQERKGQSKLRISSSLEPGLDDIGGQYTFAEEDVEQENNV